MIKRSHAVNSQILARANTDFPLVNHCAPNSGDGGFRNAQLRKVCSFSNTNPEAGVQWLVVEPGQMCGVGSTVKPCQAHVQA